MITTTLKAWINSAKNSLTNSRALIVFVALYALLLATFYFFVSTREATVWQVLVTYLFLILLPAEFFVLQAAIIDHARDLGFDWKRILRHALKIFAVTIPVVIVGWILWLLVSKLQGRFPAQLPPIIFDSKPPKSQPIHWPSLLFATLRFLLFGVALPLAAIHLWIEVTAREIRATFAGGAKAVLRRIGEALARAFASDSVFTYGLGLIVFALIPYAILSWKPNIKGTKTDFTVFILQVVLAFAFVLFGWIVTLATLVRTSKEIPEPEVVTTPTPAEAPA